MQRKIKAHLLLLSSLTFLFLVLLFSACQTENSEEKSVAELKKERDALRQEIGEKQKELDATEDKIKALDPNAQEVPKKLVTVLPLARGEFKSYSEVMGTVMADEIANASSETGGRLMEVLVSEGQYIKEGELIAKVNLEDIIKQKEQLRVQKDLAQQLYDKQAKLWEQQLGTEIQYIQAKSQLDNVNKSIESLDYQLTKSSVYAPISGTVETVQKKAGEVCAPGEPIVMILNPSKLVVRVDVPENLISNVRRGEKVMIKIPAINYEGYHTITRIGSSLNSNNRTLPISIRISSKGGTIKPNLLAVMVIKDSDVPDELIVSTNLLQMDIGGQYFVYVLDPNEGDSVAVKKIVQTGASYGGNIVIESGLAENEILIDKGARMVSDHERISVVK